MAQGYERERVLVVPTDELMKVLDFRKGLVEIEIERVKDLVRKKGFFKERNLVEDDENLRQIIPYVVIRSNGKYLVVRRLETQGEKRLHNKYSIGIGGHINTNDFDGDDLWKAVEKGMMRELNEEVNVSSNGDWKFLGIINDLSTPVSRVHTGICYIMDCEFHEINEKDKFEEMWFEKTDLLDILEKMEGWSKIVAKKINDGD